MSSNAERRDAIRKFKEQKPPSGVFAVRCSSTGRVWVGSSHNLNAIKNRFWFCLRNGDHPDKRLQAEWNAQGEDAFAYDILETIKEDTPSCAIADLLKEKSSQWRAQLGASTV